MAGISITDGGDEPGNEGSAPPSQAIVEAIAEETDTCPSELPPLFEAIDPDALDKLFIDRDNGTVTFSFCGHEITVERNGAITIQSE